MLDFGWVFVGVLAHLCGFMAFKLVNCIFETIEEHKDAKNDPEIEIEWVEENEDGSVIVGTSGMVVRVDMDTK